MHLTNYLLCALVSAVMAQPVEQAAASCSRICTKYSTTLTKTSTTILKE